MKKLLLLIALSTFAIVPAQTKLVSHHLELKKPKSDQQILTAVNTDTREVYTVASDKENTTVLKFNRALFYTDSLSVKRPDKEYTFMAGYSFEKNKDPFVYWTTKEMNKILAVQYNFTNKNTATAVYTLPLSDETIIATFSKNNTFYILNSDDKDEKLKLYIFKDGIMEQKTIDLEPFSFVTKKGKSVTFNSLLEDYPIQLIDTEMFNPLAGCTQKTKLYFTDKKIILTFDHNPKETQLFEIDLTTYETKEKKIVQPELKTDDVEANSFFNNGRLYQLKLGDDVMAFYIKDLDSGEVLKNYTVTANDTITFKNSPLYSQTGSQRPKELKNTKKLLNRLASSNIGLSVYKLNNNLLLTIGGTRYINTAGMVALGVAVGVSGIVAGGGPGDIGLLTNPSSLQVNYFENVIDKNFETVRNRMGPLAVDFISQFIEEHDDEVSLESTFTYKNFFILGYYDSKAKEYVMQKFTDEGLFK